MDRVRRRKPRWTQGFSLTEVVVSLGLLAGVSLPLAAVLVIGIDDTKVAWDARIVGNLRSTLRQQLQDPAWPKEAQKEQGWMAECTFDHRGELMENGQAAEGTVGAIKASMAAQPGLGHA